MKPSLPLSLLVFLGAAGMASASACPLEPRSVTLDSGASQQVLERDTDQVTLRQTIAASGATVDITLRAGLFTLAASRDGKEGVSFAWTGDLPAVADLVEGARFEAEAMVTSPGGLPPRPFRAKVEVRGKDTVRVGNCSFEVLVVAVRNEEAGRALGENVKWLHLPSLLTLKSTVEEGGSIRAQMAVEVK